MYNKRASCCYSATAAASIHCKNRSRVVSTPTNFDETWKLFWRFSPTRSYLIRPLEWARIPTTTTCFRCWGRSRGPSRGRRRPDLIILRCRPFAARVVCFTTAAAFTMSNALAWTPRVALHCPGGRVVLSENWVVTAPGRYHHHFSPPERISAINGPSGIYSCPTAISR